MLQCSIEVVFVEIGEPPVIVAKSDLAQFFYRYKDCQDSMESLFSTGRSETNAD